MIRKIICIDENKCIGCGLCAHACQEGAIGMVDGKARLLREDYCDGLGNCLPACPTNAITFVEREAPAFDEAAVRASQQKAVALPAAPGASQRAVFCGCATADCRRLHGLCLCCDPSGFHAWQDYLDWLSQAGRCGLC